MSKRPQFYQSTISAEIRQEVRDRDDGCVGPRLKFPESCIGALELDHVRASHGMGMKSRTSADNLVTLCSFHHRYKTDNGRMVRPILIDYLRGIYPEMSE